MKNVLWTVALGALLCAGPASFAQSSDDDAEVTRMAKEHYKQGLDAYKAGKFDVAIKELKKAYLLKRLPALLLNIGATYRKMGDYDLALHFYKKYLEEAPADARDRGEVEKTIAEIGVEKAGGNQAAEAEAAAAKENAQASKEEAPPPRAEASREWAHTPVDAAPPDTPLDVRVASPVMKGVKVFLNYRSPGEENFKSVVMKRRGPEKVGRIPADAMQGKAVQYYIEAKDPAGTVVKASGSAVSPNVVMIDPAAPSQMLASLEGEQRGRRAEEQQLQQQQEEDAPPRARRNLEDEEAPITGQIEEPRKKRSAKHGPSKFGPLFWGGVGALAGGVAALGGGIALGLVAQQKANTISGDAMNPLDVNNNKIYFNNDPNAGGSQEADLASQGKTFNAAGIALDVIGGVAMAGGAAMMIVDQLVIHGEHTERPKKRRPRPEPVDDEVSSTKNWYVSPAASHTYSGVAAGFQF
jgi:tetratricopeptide (TPR) repeat protein